MVINLILKDTFFRNGKGNRFKWLEKNLLKDQNVIIFDAVQPPLLKSYRVKDFYTQIFACDHDQLTKAPYTFFYEAQKKRKKEESLRKGEEMEKDPISTHRAEEKEITL